MVAARPVPALLGAAATEETARFPGGWAEGLLTLGGDPADVAGIVAAFRESVGTVFVRNVGRNQAAFLGMAGREWLGQGG